MRLNCEIASEGALNLPRDESNGAASFACLPAVGICQAHDDFPPFIESALMSSERAMMGHASGARTRVLTRDKRSAAVCALLVLSQATAWAQSQPEGGSNTAWIPPWSAPWVVSAVITSFDGPATTKPGRVLRVGLKNISDTTRVICVTETHVLIDGPIRGRGGWCHFRPDDDLQTATADPALQLRILEAPVDGAMRPRERWLDWSGTIASAVEAGQRLGTVNSPSNK